MGEATNGKGDRRRKQDLKKYRQNFAEIFKKFDSEKISKSVKKRKKKPKE